MKIAAMVLIFMSALATEGADQPFPLREMPDNRAIIATITIPDAARFIEHASATPWALKLGAMPLPRQFLQVFDGVGLADLDPKLPIILAMIAPDEHGNPGFSACIPATVTARYVDKAHAAGFSSVAVDHIVILGSDDRALFHARSLIDHCLRPLDTSRSDAIFRFSCTRALLGYGDGLRDQNWLARMKLSALSRPAGAPDFSPIMRMAMAGLTAVGQDSQDLQVEAVFSSSSVDADITLIARPSTDLAMALVAPAATTALAPALPGTSALTTVEGRIDPIATGRFVSTLMSRIALELDLKIPREAFAAFNVIAHDATGGFAFRARRDSDHGVSCSYVQGMSSIEAGKTLGSTIVDLFTPPGAWSRASALLGAPMGLKRLVGQRMEQDVSIDGIALSLDEGSMTAEQRAATLAFMRDGELAYTDHALLYAQSSSDLDAMIHDAQSSSPGIRVKSTAESLFGSGHGFYAECDLAGDLSASWAIAAKGSQEKPSPLVALHEGENLLLAGDFAAGGARWRIRIPLAPIADIVRAASMAELLEWLATPATVP